MSNQYISLSKTKDCYGNKKACIKWHVSDADINKFKKIGNNFVNDWNEMFHEIEIEDSNKYSNEKPYDVYHPVGTCRIGSDEKAVVDLNFKVKNHSNLYTINSGIIPTAGIANPTFSLFCFAEHLTKVINK